MLKDNVYNIRGEKIIIIKSYTGEEERAQRGVHDVQDVVADEDAEDPEEEEDDHTHKQDSGTGSEVIFGLCGFAKKNNKQTRQGSHQLSLVKTTPPPQFHSLEEYFQEILP